MVGGMTARLRLLLAILVLALAPVMGPVAVAAPMAVMADVSCVHGCDGDTHSATCTVSCALHAVMPPLAVVVDKVPMAGDLRRPLPQDVSLASARWPPPLRPPRFS